MATPPIPTPPGNPSGYEQVIVPSAPQAAPGYPPAPSQIYTQPPAPGSSNTVVKIILIVVGIIVLFGILAAAVIGFGAYKLSKAVHRARNGDVTFSTPDGGTFTTGSGAGVTSADLGLPDYPGAIRSSKGTKISSPRGTIVIANFTSTDPIAKVTAFYKDKLGPDSTVAEHPSNTTLTSGDTGQDKKIVTLIDHAGTTKISIMHTSHGAQ